MTEEIKIEHTEKGGIGTLAFMLIPAALAGAALMWLAFVTGIIGLKHSQSDYAKQQTYEGRREQRVGVNGEILKPIDLVFTSHGCVKIDRAFLDTQTLTLYLHNTCNSDRGFIKSAVHEYSPDGTVIQTEGGWIHPGDDSGMLANEKRELVVETSNDARTVKIVASVDSGQ